RLNEPGLAQDAHANCQRQREQALIGADVAGRALTTNVLFTRGEREHEAAFAVAIDGLAADTAGHLLQELALVAASEQSHARPAELRRASQRLAFADRDVCTQG